MSTIYEQLAEKARWVSDKVEAGSTWRPDHEELRDGLWRLEDLYADVLRSADTLAKIDSEARPFAEKDEELACARKLALQAVAGISSKLYRLCKSFGVDRYETEIRLEKLKQVEGLCRALLAGVDIGKHVDASNRAPPTEGMAARDFAAKYSR